MTTVLKLLCLSLLLGFCRGWAELWVLDSYQSVCPGETVSFEVDLTNPNGHNIVVLWSPLYIDSEHYSRSLDEDVTVHVFTIYDAKPNHTGYFEVVAKDRVDGSIWDVVHFYLHVPDVHLHPLVKSPVKVELGGKATLMVNKSDAGDLAWLHNGAYLGGDKDIHLTQTERLEIFNATAEQDAGFYEAWLRSGSCTMRNTFEVQVQEVEKSTVESDIESESNIYKYLKVFSGDFTGEWYVAPAVLALIVILFLALIICIIRQKRKEMRSKRKDKGDQGVKRQILFEEPIYTVQDQVVYPSADRTYDIAPVTSSHPQSTSLRSYGEPMPLYESLLGPPVPPPPTGLRQTYSAMRDLDSSDD